MKVNLNFAILDLDGNAIPDTNAGKLLANTLVYQPEGDVIKLYDWALELNRGNTIDLDKADQAFITKFVKESRGITLLAKRQILDCLVKE